MDTLELLDSSSAQAVDSSNAAWLYCDAEAYYKALVEACEKAEESILICGWDLHSDTALILERKPHSLRTRKVLLRKFLIRLLRQNPRLHIYLLTWDFNAVFIWEREKLQSLRRGWLSHPRIHFKLDGAHPISASQHQKFVVVDGQVAFAGGLDLTIRRWDNCQHSHNAPLRKDPDGEPYGPFHDYQIGVSGPIVQHFLKLFRERWYTATGESLASLQPVLRTIDNPLPDNTVVSFEQARIAFSRTQPAFKDMPEVTEIAVLFERLIAHAKRQIVLENQYLTAHLIVKSLSESLQKPEGPEVVIILPEKAGGWLEKRTMGLLQDLALKSILASDIHKRLRILYPFDRWRDEHGVSMTVHSKLVMIDDDFLSIGSANLNNRSMGYDSELQLTIDARESPEHQAVIAQCRAYVLAHHTELSPEAMAAALEQSGSMVQTIDRLQSSGDTRYLQTFPLRDDTGSLHMDDLNWLDMEKPSPIEHAMDQWGQASEYVTGRIGVPPRVIVLGLTILFAIGLALLWRFTDLRSIATESGLKELLQSPENAPHFAKYIMPVIFGVGAVIFLPINLLILVCASLFTTGWAFFQIFIGTIVNVTVGYGVGRLAGRFIFRRFFGKKTQKILGHIGRGQFWTILLIRIVPIAPGSLINLAAGSGQVPYFKFMLATLLGMMPGTIMLVLFQKSVIDLFLKPSFLSVGIVAILGLVTFFLFRWSRKRFSQYQQRSPT